MARSSTPDRRGAAAATSLSSPSSAYSRRAGVEIEIRDISLAGDPGLSSAWR